MSRLDDKDKIERSMLKSTIGYRDRPLTGFAIRPSKHSVPASPLEAQRGHLGGRRHKMKITLARIESKDVPV